MIHEIEKMVINIHSKKKSHKHTGNIDTAKAAGVDAEVGNQLKTFGNFCSGQK